jgi:hypothetical protein
MNDWSMKESKHDWGVLYHRLSEFFCFGMGFFLSFVLRRERDGMIG